MPVTVLVKDLELYIVYVMRKLSMSVMRKTKKKRKREDCQYLVCPSVRKRGGGGIVKISC